MKSLPIHENLDTSFVNLSALVRYLRRREFAGNVRVELNGYEAEITLDGGSSLRVREHDRIAGRIAEGEEAFERLLIRAREPGGSIHVYQFVEDAETIEQKIQAIAENGDVKPFVQKEILTQAPATNGGEKKHEIKFDKSRNDQSEASPPPPPPVNSSALPFEFSNRVEEKARKAQISGEDWQTLMQLTAELLSAVDKSLGAAGLDFSSAFAKACTEISDDYPFLNSSSGVFAYTGGKITMRGQVSPKLFTASINEALRRILEKLGANPKFAGGVYRQTVQTVLALIHQRRPLYDKFFITPQLEKILGV